MFIITVLWQALSIYREVTEKVGVPVFKQHNVSYTDVQKRRCCADVGPMSKITSCGHRLTMHSTVRKTLTRRTAYRLRVNVNGIAIMSYGNKTLNIYVKNCTVYTNSVRVTLWLEIQNCKDHHYKIPTSSLHTVSMYEPYSQCDNEVGIL